MAGVGLGLAAKVTDLPLNWNIAGIIVSGAIQIGTYLAGESNKKRVAMGNELLAYLYYAKQEHIVS
jgi:hypothetical protein